MFAWIRLLAAAFVFGLTLDVGIRALLRHLRARRPRYGALPWDPSAVVRTAPLTGPEAAIARRLETLLTGPSTVNSV